MLQGLDRHSKAALALIYMRNDSLESPIELEPSEHEALARLGSDLGECVTALEALDGSLVVHSHASGKAVWRFKHPTIGDAYAEFLWTAPGRSASSFGAARREESSIRSPAGTLASRKLLSCPGPCFP